MKVLYGARLARFDLLKAVAGLASKVTKWSVSCDETVSLDVLHKRLQGTEDARVRW